MSEKRYDFARVSLDRLGPLLITPQSEQYIEEAQKNPTVHDIVARTRSLTLTKPEFSSEEPERPSSVDGDVTPHPYRPESLTVDIFEYGCRDV